MAPSESLLEKSDKIIVVAENPSAKESFADGNPPAAKSASDSKIGRRLSFSQSVGQISAANSKNRINRSRQYLRQNSQVYPISETIAALQSADRFISQRSSFDLHDLRQITFILCCLGWLAGLVGFLIQAIANAHGTLNWTWSVGFWSGSVFMIHATVGCLTLWRKLQLRLRAAIAKTYFVCSGLLVLSSTAEITCAVYTYNHGSDLINGTASHTKEYKVYAMEMSVINTLISGCGLLGVLMAIFAIVVTLQRLNIDLKIAQSFSTLISRRPSATPALTVDKKPNDRISDDDDVDV